MTNKIETLTFLILLLSLSFQSSNAEESPFLNSRVVGSNGIARLERIEKTVLPAAIEFGPAQHSEIVDYYCDANAELQDRCATARNVFEANKFPRFRAMTIVAGSAGIGKTFIKRQIYQDIPTDHVWKFDIREIFEGLAKQGLAKSTPDLVLGSRVLNSMLRLTSEGRKAFARLTEARSTSFVIADSLDEIHPDDYLFVLGQLKRISLGSDQDFVHLVVFGRPVAFADYWRTHGLEADRNSDSSDLVSFVLRKPEFRTTGDLVVSNWNFDCWKHGLRRGELGQSRPVSLGEYRQWCQRGYCVTGEFADIVFSKNLHMTEQARGLLQDCALECRVVASVLSNLAGNAMTREILVDNVRQGEMYDERRFMTAFFGKWLERDTLSDGRPSRLNQAHLHVYMKLLEQIAAQYATEDRIDERGYFEVSESDQVMIADQGGVVSVPARRVLDRSGLVTVDPLAPMSQRLRFEPFWFHRYLLQSYRERAGSPLKISRVTTASSQTAN